MSLTSTLLSAALIVHLSAAGAQTCAPEILDSATPELINGRYYIHPRINGSDASLVVGSRSVVFCGSSLTVLVATQVSKCNAN
jgi:hypothetical protein